MFKWPVIVLPALSNLCFFILLMPLEEILLPNTKGELLLTLSSYSCQSKFITKTLKFFTNAEILRHLNVICFYLSVSLELHYCD